MRSTRVRTAGQLTLVEELRRQILGEEPQMVRSAPSPVRGRGLEPVDRQSRLWLAWDGDHPVGTIRATFGADVDLRRHYPAWALRPFIEAAGPDRLVAYSHLLVRREYRSRLVAPLLMLEAARCTFAHGVDVGFVCCEPDAVDRFEALGFRRYPAVTCDRVREMPVPMVLLFSDRDHLDRVGSPLRNRVPDSITSKPDPMLARLVAGRADPPGQEKAAAIGPWNAAACSRRPSTPSSFAPSSPDGIRPAPASGRASS